MARRADRTTGAADRTTGGADGTAGAAAARDSALGQGRREAERKGSDCQDYCF